MIHRTCTSHAEGQSGTQASMCRDGKQLACAFLLVYIHPFGAVVDDQIVVNGRG